MSLALIAFVLFSVLEEISGQTQNSTYPYCQSEINNCMNSTACSTLWNLTTDCMSVGNPFCTSSINNNIQEFLCVSPCLLNSDDEAYVINKNLTQNDTQWVKLNECIGTLVPYCSIFMQNCMYDSVCLNQSLGFEVNCIANSSECSSITPQSSREDYYDCLSFCNQEAPNNQNSNFQIYSTCVNIIKELDCQKFLTNCQDNLVCEAGTVITMDCASNQNSNAGCAALENALENGQDANVTKHNIYDCFYSCMSKVPIKNNNQWSNLEQCVQNMSSVNIQMIILELILLSLILVIGF